MHTGECEAVAGLTGAAVDVAHAVARNAAPGEVLVSSTVTSLVSGSGFRFEGRGASLADRMQLFAVAGVSGR